MMGSVGNWGWVIGDWGRKAKIGNRKSGKLKHKRDET
jgi:N-acetylglucosamine kinase-like BadF-type ATPase